MFSFSLSSAYFSQYLCVDPTVAPLCLHGGMGLAAQEKPMKDTKQRQVAGVGVTAAKVARGSRCCWQGLTSVHRHAVRLTFTSLHSNQPTIWKQLP